MTRKRYAELAARARVPLGFLIVAVYAALARPTAARLAAGAAMALAGLMLRGWAAGYLEKNIALATGGPYAHTRNPLYLGTAITAAGFAWAGGSWLLAALLAAFLLLVYLPVVGEEEAYLAVLFGEYKEYAARVPRFWPSLQPRWESGQLFRWSLYIRNQEYNAVVGYLFALALLGWKSL